MATTNERGYDLAHKQLRAQWQLVIDAGDGWCHASICFYPSRHIEPGSPWDLGHTPDRTAWTGPEHPRCNRSEGGRRGREAQRHKASREW